MYYAGSVSLRSRLGRCMRALLAIVVTVLAGSLIAAQQVQAATYNDPVLGTPQNVAGSIGAPDGNVDTTVGCGAGRILTALDAVHIVSWLTGVQPECAPIVGGSSVHLGAQSPAGILSGFRGAMPTGEVSQCPTGTVAVGLGGRGGTLVDAVQLACRAVNADGTLDSTLQDATYAGGSGGGAVPAFLCPDGAVVTQVYAQLGQDITNVRIRCSSLTVTPAVAPQPDNTSWPHARLISGTSHVTDQQIDTPGEQLWYAIPVQPGSQMTVNLGGLSNNLDLAVFKDIRQAFSQLTSVQDLTHLSAEFAGDAFAPSVFSPSVFSPSVFSPSVFSPSVFSPSVFSPSVFSPSVFSPSVFSPSVFSPSVFSPSVFSPAVSLPSVFSPSVFSGGTPNQATLAEAFSSAQIRSLVGVSASDGTVAEAVTAPTWTNTGDYYVRVSGRNGATSAFDLTVSTSGGPCDGVTLDDFVGLNTLAGSGGANAPTTVVLTDPARMAGSASDKAALATAVNNFASQVGGAVVDLGQSARVVALNQQADAHPSCPYAENLVAQSIRDIVNSYRGPSLKYVVIVGGDSVVPFFRYADTAGLGPETGYYPPMSDGSPAQAALRSDDFLSQDAYGSAVDVSIKGSTFPVPDLAVGRLVETPSEITTTLTRYASTPVIRPTATLATGYDFLADSAHSVATDFAAGNPSGRNDTLIAAQGAPGSQLWTASDLSTSLLGRRHDVVYLAGHFSANSALAADYATSLLTTQLAASSTDFTNSLVFSAGCHSGYNIVDQQGVPGVTFGLDWAQAFAQKGATLVAGTGYQYGDTDFVAYSEKLYALLAHDLREGTGVVSVGAALTQAKQDYLAGLTSVTGIDQKSLLEATLFGLPMQGVDFAGRLPAPTPGPGVAATGVDSSTPGGQLGLQSALLNVTPALTARTTTLNVTSGGTVAASYLTGPDGVVSSPGAPTLPLLSQNVTVNGQVLRGVGLRSATYSDTDAITPLTAAAATEQSAAHVPFTSAAFYPNRLASPDYFGALAGGQTTLNITPAQYRSDGSGLTDTERRYSQLGLQLFYSSNIGSYGPNTPALAAPPSISGVSAQAATDGSTVHVQVHVVGDPSAGIQQTWITYTGEAGSALHGAWQSVDLTQDGSDSTLWTGDIAVPDNRAEKLRFLVQAANGVGEVGVDDNLGSYYSAAVSPGALPQLTKTRIALDPSAPAHVTLGSGVGVGATLTDGSGNPIAGMQLYFSLGAAGATGTTDASGHATATVTPTSAGRATVTALFSATGTYAGATSDPAAVTVDRPATALSLRRNADGSFTARLTDGSGGGLVGQTVTLVSGSAGATVAAVPAQTALDGTTAFATTAVPPAADTVQAWFGSPQTPVPGGTSDQTSSTYLPSSSSPLRPAALTLTAGPGESSDFGARVTFAVTAGLAGSGSQPSGSVRFAVDGTVVGSTSLRSDGTATIATTALLPGRHTVTVSYGGDAAFLPSAASVTQTVTCAHTVTGTVRGNLSASGSSYCLVNAQVSGVLTFGKNVKVAIVGSKVGAVALSGGGQFMMCGSTTLAVVVDRATGLVVVGDPGHSQCAPNAMVALTLTNDLFGVEAINNTVPIVITSKIGGAGPYPGDVTTVSGNHR